MANEQQKKQAQQVIILLVLLGVFLAMVFIVLVPGMKQGSGKHKGKRTPAAAKKDAGAGQTAKAGGPGTATDMPKVAGKSGPTGQQLAAGVENVSGVPTGLNPNLFQVFELGVTRNPFVQQEEWYTDELAKAMPGYPELRDSGYFNSMEPYLPDLNSIFGERDWSSVSIQRNQKNNYSLSGTSEDGKIDTSISLTENIPTDQALTWTPASGIPLSSLTDPDYVAGLNLPATGGQVGGGNLKGGVAVPDSNDLFQGSSGDGALPNMDEYMQANGGSQDQLGPNAGLLGKGDQLTCRGVNLARGTASALLDFNGAPYLVKVGDILPTHYQVLDVKGDGVMIKELRDGSTQWLPITLLMEPAAQQPRAK
jgi:hypothetical protein